MRSLLLMASVPVASAASSSRIPRRWRRSPGCIRPSPSVGTSDSPPTGMPLSGPLSGASAYVVRSQDHLRPLPDAVRLSEAELGLLRREHGDDGVEHGQVERRHGLPRRLQPAQEERRPLLPEVQGEVGQAGVGAKHGPAVDEAQRRVLSLELILNLRGRMTRGQINSIWIELRRWGTQSALSPFHTSLSLVSSRYGFPCAAASASVTTSTGILLGPAKRSTVTGETAVTPRTKARCPALEEKRDNKADGWRWIFKMFKANLTEPFRQR